MPADEETVKSLIRKSELLNYMGYTRESKIYKEVSKRDTMTEEFILDVSPEEYDSSGSKFASAGLHTAELGLPEWETVGSSIRFPFIIVEDGADKGRDGKIVAGISKKAIWKMKEILEAAGVPTTKTADGKVTFDKNAVVGKKVKILYTKEVDTRSAEEGGTGTEYTKASAAYPESTTSESLGI